MYAELHCRTNFSFLCGASHPEEIVQCAAKLELPALAITDVNGVYGIVRAWEALRYLENTQSVALIYGVELTTEDDNDTLVLLARSKRGYAKISQAISKGRLHTEKGVFSLHKNDALTLGGEEIIVLAGGPRSYLFRLLTHEQEKEAAKELSRLKEAFGAAVYLEVVRYCRPGDKQRSLAIASLGEKFNVPIVATNDVLFHCRERKKLHDILTCIKEGISLHKAGRILLPNAERCLKSAAEMQTLFHDLPQAIDKTIEIAQRCHFKLEDLQYSYPTEAVPPGETADSFLAKLAKQGLIERLGAKRARLYQDQLNKELQLIRQLDYAGYFLTMWEVIKFCEQKGILCQGRGSAANSIVCYATKITSVSPDQIDMLFERFLSVERREPPDIDLDIEH
ncbi:MAG: PHP domain-containing protein, partial [Pseudomonadota bacterium]